MVHEEVSFEVESNKRLRLFVSILEVTFVTDSPIGHEIVIQPIKTHEGLRNGHGWMDWYFSGERSG